MATRVLVIDSYDSFVFNLVQYLGELGADPIVHRNDAFTVDDAVAIDPDGVLLSPVPGARNAGILCDVVPAFAARGVPILGVCLGHQAIGQAYGATVVGAATLMHGKTSAIAHDGSRGVRRLAVSVDRDTLPLAHAGPGLDSRRPCRHGNGGRRHRDGRPPPPAPRRRHAVPSREHPHRLRSRAARQLPGELRRCSPAAL